MRKLTGIFCILFGAAIVFGHMVWVIGWEKTSLVVFFTVATCASIIGGIALMIGKK